MQIKEWTYDEYPAFEEYVEGAVRLHTTGDEKGTYIDSMWSRPMWMGFR